MDVKDYFDEASVENNNYELWRWGCHPSVPAGKGIKLSRIFLKL